MPDITRVLIVDDEPLTGKVLCDILTPGGCDCVTAAGAGPALEILSQEIIDLALIDIMLPETSGLELLDSIKMSFPSLPVIMITALSDAATAVQAMKKGAADYLVKPFALDEVGRRIDAVLQEHRHPTGFPAAPVTGRIITIAQGVEALVDHFDFHDRIVTERTIEIARRLAIPETDIRAWAAARRKSQAQQEKSIGLVSGLFDREPDGFAGQTQP